jgi:hypothetical protein
MDRPAPHEMHQSDGVAEVKDRSASGEGVFAALQSLKEGIQFLKHDCYHVVDNGHVASLL